MSSSAAPSDMIGKVRSAILWRSGSQILAQLVAWGSTFLVIRMLGPEDYGLFAMTQVILVLLNTMNGYGLASALIREEQVTDRRLRQILGMLILLNGGLALLQFLLAPLVAGYFAQPMVADILRVQAVLYLITPFLALPHAILSRQMEFRRPAQIRMAAALAGAATALACAMGGAGVWTLVFAPMALFLTEAVGMTVAARAPLRPVFDFSGAGGVASFGGLMTATQLFWFVQNQSDVIIAGRVLTVADLGVYTTALFLAQLFAAKFVPPINEVAYAAYARMQGRQADASLATIRLIMLIACPFYVGMAVSADPLVAVVLGDQWVGIAALLPALALAMLLLTLQILFAPATNAAGHPGVALRISIWGSILMPAACLAAMPWGLPGFAWAWVAAMAMLLAITMASSLPLLGLSARDVTMACLPQLAAGLAMGGLLWAIDGHVFWPTEPLRLCALVAGGLLLYPAILMLIAPERLREAVRLVGYGSMSANDNHSQEG